jgi:hypothetical protein
MSEIKVDTLSTVSGSGNLTVSNNIVGSGTISGTNLTASGTLTSTGLITASAGVAIGGTGAVNTLDDYEEGTFTPVLTRWTSDMTFTGSPHSRVGKYIKIGKLVQINFYIQWATSAVSSAGSGGWRITGLPFSNYETNSVNFLPLGYHYDGIDSKGESTTGDSARLQVNYSSGILDMYSQNSGSYGTSGSWFIISACGTLRLA